MSPDSRDVSLRYVGNSSSHREEIPNRRVWSQVLLPDVGLLNMLQEGFLVVEVTSSSGSGGPHGSNCVVNGELVVHEDGLWLVAPRSPLWIAISDLHTAVLYVLMSCDVIDSMLGYG